MGLDMCLEKAPKGEYDDPTELAYRRKFNALHGYITKNFWSGKEDNTTPIPLTMDNVKQILGVLKAVHKAKTKSVAMKLLPVTEGFFFGNYDPDDGYDEYYREDVKASIKKLTQVLKENKNNREGIYYYAWY